MKIHLNMLTFILILMMGLVGCGSPVVRSAETQVEPVQPTVTEVAPTETVLTESPPNPPTPTLDPNAEVVLNMVERLNAGDVDGSLAYFADNSLSYFIGMPPTGIEYYQGAEALRAIWDYCVEDHFEWEIEITEVKGDLVFAKAKTWLDFTRGLEVAPNEFTEVYQVKDGKITIYGSTMTEAALARFKPAFYEVAPPEPTAVPLSDTPVSEITVTIADGTCTSDGPAALQAGEVTITLNVEDQEKSLYGLTLFNLDPGKDILDLMASTAGTPPDWADILLMEELGPGKRESYAITLEKGPVYLICWSQPPALPIGNAGPIEVVIATPTPTPPVRGESDLMFTFTDKRCTYEGPEMLSSGDTTVIMNMQGLDKYKIANAMMFFTLDPSYELKDLVDAIWMPSPPEWAQLLYMREAKPGEVTVDEFTVEAGPLYFICLSGESEETAKLVGKGGPLEVSP